MKRLRTRFAPSPTGFLHLGHAASAFTVWDFAASNDAEVVLRIEDVDQTRCRPEFEAGILADLSWLGLKWPEPVRRQSDHFDDYARVFGSLGERGLIYRCFRTRKEVMADVARAPHGSPEAFFGTPLGEDEEAARVEAGDPFAWRLSLARARDELGSAYDRLGFEELEEGGHRFVRAEPEAFGDVVIARKDTPASYHLSSCHDDTLQGVTHIVRGEDLFASTSVHVLLQALMGWPTPIYRHHRLLTGEDGKRLSKRDKSTSLRSMRAAGIIPDEIRQRTGPPL